ncbi:hypothetical protein BGW80DRAFT_1462285 [Lactifluus volemus]|nr:hypothetical protein BGW80DRAFT_1462285 [Lactifluus volemus]
MTSWIESSHDFRLNPSYFPALLGDHPDGNIPGVDHPPSLHTSYTYTPHHSPSISRQTQTQTFNYGLYGPRPQPTHPDAMQPFPTLPAPVVPGMLEPEDAYEEYMEVDPGVDAAPMLESGYDDENPSQGKLRFVGGFIRGLRKIPRAVRRGFLSDKRELQTPPGLAYHDTLYGPPYIVPSQPEEDEEAPPYDMPAESVEGDVRYVEGMNMPTELLPSRTPSQTIRSPPHDSLHHAPKSSPPRTVRNPDPNPVSPTEESGPTSGNSLRMPSPRPFQADPDLEPEPRTPRVAPLRPTRRPTVTVQSPTGNPVYIEPPQADDYVGMASPVEDPPEPSVPSQFARIRKFFRDLNDLPWVSPTVTVDFDPTNSERARAAGTAGPGRSWYTGQLRDLDLLGGGSSSSTRKLTAPSGHSLAPPQGSNATLEPHNGSGSAASSSEGVSTHLPTAHVQPPHAYPVPPFALSPQPLYLYPFTYHAMPTPPQPPPPTSSSSPLPSPSRSRQPNGGAEKLSPQSSPFPSPSTSRSRQPNGPAEQVSPQPSGQSDFSRQPYLYMVAIPPGYLPGQVDPSRPMQMQPAYVTPYPPLSPPV